MSTGGARSVLPASRTTILDVLRHSMSGNLKFVLDNQVRERLKRAARDSPVTPPC